MKDDDGSHARAGKGFVQGMSFLGKVVVSLLWATGGFAGFTGGAPLVGLAAVAYLAYLWIFGGRWLIY